MCSKHFGAWPTSYLRGTRSPQGIRLGIYRSRGRSSRYCYSRGRLTNPRIKGRDRIHWRTRRDLRQRRPRPRRRQHTGSTRTPKSVRETRCRPKGDSEFLQPMGALRVLYDTCPDILEALWRLTLPVPGCTLGSHGAFDLIDVAVGGAAAGTVAAGNE